MRDDLADAGMQLVQTLLERGADAWDDDARLDQPYAPVAALDRPVSSRAQRGIDAEDADARVLQGGGVPLTVTPTDEPGASVDPASGLVPMTFPSAPAVVVYCHPAIE